MPATNYLNSPVGKTLLLKSLPMFIGIFANIAYNLVDTYFVAKLGTSELAAMSFSFPIVMIIINIMMGVGTALSSIVSRHIGAGRIPESKEANSQGILFTILLSGCLSLIGLFTLGPLFRTLGVDDSIMHHVQDYITVWYIGMVFMNLSILGGALFRAKGNVAYPSLILFCGAALNAILDPILIFGWGPIPALGIKGASLTTVLGNGISAIFLYARLFKEGDISAKQIFATYKLKVHAAIARIALPTALASSMVPASTAYTNWLLVSHGNAAVAGNSIATRIETVPFIAIFALGSVLAPFIGQNWGAKQFSRIRSGIKKSFLFSYLLGTFCAVILILNKNSIHLLFANSPGIEAVTTLYFRFIPLTYGILGTVFLTTYSMNAIGRPFLGNILSASRLILLYIPLSTLLNSIMGIEGIFLARVTANTTVGILATLLVYRTFFKKTPELMTTP